MKHINIEECLSLIDKSRINCANHANVYVAATDNEIVMQFAYSEERSDHIVLKNSRTPSSRSQCDEMWWEFLAVSMILEHAFRVRRIVDDVRGYAND